MYFRTEMEAGQINQSKVEQACHVGGEFTAKDTRANSYSYQKSHEEPFQTSMKRIQTWLLSKI